MTKHEAIERNTHSPCLTSLDTLVAHAIDARMSVRMTTDAWADMYEAGACSPHQIVTALYGCQQPLHDAIAELEKAKQYCRQALGRPLRKLHAPVELLGQAIVRWVAPTQTVSYAPKTMAAITADLHASLLPLLPSLDTLGTLLPIISAAQERGALSAAETDALVSIIDDLVCGCRAAQAAAQRLCEARTEGSRAGYVKVEVDRSPLTPGSNLSG